MDIFTSERNIQETDITSENVQGTDITSEWEEYTGDEFYK